MRVDFVSTLENRIQLRFPLVTRVWKYGNFSVFFPLVVKPMLTGASILLCRIYIFQAVSNQNMDIKYDVSLSPVLKECHTLCALKNCRISIFNYWKLWYYILQLMVGGNDLEEMMCTCARYLSARQPHTLQQVKPQLSFQQVFNLLICFIIWPKQLAWCMHIYI